MPAVRSARRLRVISLDGIQVVDFQSLQQASRALGVSTKFLKALCAADRQWLGLSFELFTSERNKFNRSPDEQDLARLIAFTKRHAAREAKENASRAIQQWANAKPHPSPQQQQPDAH